MRARLLALAGLTVVAFGVTGCPKNWENGECESSDNCKGQKGYENDVCVDKKCVECGANSDCHDGLVCQANKCVPKPECGSNADCGAGKACQAGKCVTSGCSKQSDCPGGKCMDGQCASASACKTTKDCTGNQTCQAGICSEPQAAGPCQLQKIQFGFNESSLDGAAQDTLKSDAQCIQQRKLAVTLEGNADERGTEEYNLHLGERRAASVKTYLQKLGVESGKMKTISYGKERPVNPGHDEAAWAENRRVDVVER